METGRYFTPGMVARVDGPSSTISPVASCSCAQCISRQSTGSGTFVASTTIGSAVSEAASTSAFEPRGFGRGCEIQGIKTRSSDGNEKHLLQEALKGVRKAAQDVPVGVHLSECEKFVERAQKRLASHDEVRGKLVLELQEGQTRLSKLRAEVAKVFVLHPIWQRRWPDCSRWWTLSQHSAVLLSRCQDP